jgi:Ca2+-binding EF-hand superfamily protein
MKNQILLVALLSLAVTASAQTTVSSQKQPVTLPAQMAGAKVVNKSAIDELTMTRHQMEKFDTNHDGKLSKEEFLAPGVKAFNDMDANHDGFLTPEKMIAFRQKMAAEAETRALVAAVQAKAAMGTNSSGISLPAPGAKPAAK